MDSIKLWSVFPDFTERGNSDVMTYNMRISLLNIVENDVKHNNRYKMRHM
jgi:hypothetical protein